MVRAALVVAVLGACTPEISSGTYFCGANALCPEGMECNAGDDMNPETFDNVCVLEGSAQPFSCGLVDTENDDVPTSGRIVADLSCVSGVHEARGCLTDTDLGDWFQFDVPDNCTAVQIEARVVFPTSFEPVALQISSNDGAAMPAETPCVGPSDDESGSQQRCFKLTVENGSHHAIGVVHSDVDNCNGLCANNRYTLGLQLSTP